MGASDPPVAAAQRRLFIVASRSALLSADESNVFALAGREQAAQGGQAQARLALI
jgi:hypothetical protein